MRDIGPRRECIQTMQNDAHLVMFTFGMREQNAHAVIFLYDSNARPNFVNHAKNHVCANVFLVLPQNQV